MAQVPEAFVGGDKAFERAAAILFGGNAAAGQHGLERFEQLFGHYQVLRVAGVMEGDQDLVGQSATMAGAAGPGAVAAVSDV
jgi:hypothetical protein